MGTLTESYAEFSKGLKIKDIPAEVRQRVGELILDTLGVGIAGSNKSSSSDGTKEHGDPDKSKRGHAVGNARTEFYIRCRVC